jgi:hypothetical protein
MDQPKWHFNTLRKCDKVRDPTSSEYFTDNAVPKPGEALVREGIQNSLDARHDNEKVRVRIRLATSQLTRSSSELSVFLEGLSDHLKAPENGLRDIPSDNEPCRFLVFEDFGTTGLTGDIGAWKPAQGSKNRFLHFFRAEGRSDKSGKDMGRWGVGKQVFPRCSRINTIFGLTVRADDNREVLMGMSVLKSHEANGDSYAPDGWFGCRSDPNDLVMPVEDRDLITKFKKVFGVQRREKESGLSIVVPWVDQDIKFADLVEGVLKHFFWPILKGVLEVQIEAEPEQPIKLDRQSVQSEIRTLNGELQKQYAPLIQLAQWAQQDPQHRDGKTIQLNSPQGDKPPQWSEQLFPADSLSGIRESFEKGEKIAIRVPVRVRENGKDARQSYFDVFLVWNPGSDSDYGGRPVYIREGIVIPDVRPRGLGILRGVRSLVVAEDEAIAAFLGDAENPAHTQWQANGTNFKGKYQHGKETLSFVINSVIEIVRIITDQQRKEDWMLMMDLFSIPVPPGEQESQETAGNQQNEESSQQHPVPSGLKKKTWPFQIKKIDGGFEICDTNAVNQQPLPLSLTIRVAYDVQRGNAFRKYSPLDFDLSDQAKFNVTTTGCTVKERRENEIKLEVTQQNFSIRVTGFDKNRDLRVEVSCKEARNAGSDA